MESFFERPQRRHIRELNLVAIIDMFTTVIFFLLLSTTFIAMTKLTLPPTRTTTAPPHSNVIPLLPKLLIHETALNTALQLELTWQGPQPGKETRDVSKADRQAIQVAAESLVSKFISQHPEETNLQLGFSKNLSYEVLIAAMDGVRKRTSSVILLSYAEAGEIHP